MGVGKLPLPGEEPTKRQEVARRQRGVRDDGEHAREDTSARGDGQTGATLTSPRAWTNLGGVARTSSRRRLTALAAVAVAAGLVAPATGLGALTATSVSLHGRAAYEQVVVSFGGGTLSGLQRQVDALDPAPGDGRAVVRVNGRGITATAAPATRAGVRARLARRPGNVLVLLDAPPGRFKFVSYAVDGTHRHLVIRLWRATTSSAARILDDGCLRLTRWSGHAQAVIRGLELTPLFEHGLVLSLREADAGARTIAQTPVTATPGVFLPDFSGYRSPGRWSGRLPFAIAAPVGTPAALPAMLEAWSTSAKDGSLECLVQTPVVARP